MTDRQKHELRAELERCDRLIEQNPGNSSAYLKRADIHCRLGAEAAALADYSRAIYLNPTDPDGYFNRGILHYRAGRWEDAISDYTSTLDRDPMDAEAYTNRGFVFEQLKNWRKALEDYDQALRIKPHLTVPRLNRGNTLLAMGEVDGAIAAYDDAIEHSPRTPLLHVLRAEAYLARGDLEGAINDLNRARTLGYTSPELELKRGRVYHALRQPENAVSALMEAIRDNPSNAFAHGLCGHNLMKLGHFDAARSFLEKSIELDPLSHATHFSMGMLLQRLGEAARAEDHFAKADTLKVAEQSPSPIPTAHIVSVSTADESVGMVSIDRIHDETRTFRAKYGPPFSRFVGYGRRMTLTLSPLQSLAMALAFPVFCGRSTIDKDGASLPEPYRKLSGHISFGDKTERQLRQRRFVRRRYSGDTHAELSRSRYLALAGTRNAPASYTLLAEMNAYAVPLMTGYCAAVLGSDGESIDVVFRGLPGETNPLHHLVTEPGRFSFLFDESPNDPRDLITPQVKAEVSSETIFVVPVPHEDVQIQLDNAFDLRLADTRRWMVEYFRNPPPVDTDDDLVHGGMLLDIASRYGFDLAGVCDWRTLLPVTNGTGFGGNAMLDLFAVFLRRLGCDGLIYPSARCDHGVILDDGVPIYAWGWNLVDYRGAVFPQRVSLEEIMPLEGLVGIRHSAELSDGVHKGSFAHLGNSLYTCVTKQRSYDEYCLMHGPEWRSKHNARELSVRGYSWFRRTYSLRKDCSALVTCDKCQSTCPVDRAFLPRCPECGFSGDTGVFVEVSALLLPHLQSM